MRPWLVEFGMILFLMEDALLMVMTQMFGWTSGSHYCLNKLSLLVLLSGWHSLIIYVVLRFLTSQLIAGMTRENVS